MTTDGGQEARRQRTLRINMNSDLTVTQMSRGAGPAVHYYYDVPIESPDRQRILYYEFDSEAIPGPGKVIVADADGGNPRAVGEAAESIGHVGAQAQWVGPDCIAWSPRQQSEGKTTVVDLSTGERTDLPRTMRSYCPINHIGALIGGGGGFGATRDLVRIQSLVLWDSRTGAMRPRLDVHQAHASHPLRDQFDPAKTNFQNAKFSPDGSQLFIVFGTEVYRNMSGDRDYPRIKSLLRMSVEGDDVSYIGEFGHHPMWTPVGDAIIAYVVRDGVQDLMRYPLDGSEATVFMADLPGVHCSLDRAGRRLVTDVFMGQKPGRAEILLIDVDTGRRSTLAEGAHERCGHVNGSHPHPQWSADESRIFFNMADTGVPQLYSVTL